MPAEVVTKARQTKIIFFCSCYKLSFKTHMLYIVKKYFVQM